MRQAEPGLTATTADRVRSNVIGNHGARAIAEAATTITTLRRLQFVQSYVLAAVLTLTRHCTVLNAMRSGVPVSRL